MAKAGEAGLSERQGVQIARALADPRRYEILTQIGAHDGPMSCRALLALHDVSAATMSHHLKELEGAELIAVERDGKSMLLKVRRKMLKAYTRRLNKI